MEAITIFLEDGIKSMISDRNINNVVSIACVSVASQQFKPDQIHLTKASAKTFLDVTLGLAETFFNAPFVDLTEQGEVNDSDDAAHIARLEDRLSRLERTMRMQMDTNVANDLVLARVREEVDAGTNKAKEDRIVINGLSSSKPLPEDPKPRIEALKLIVSDIFKSIIPNFGGKIVYLSQGKHVAAFLPMVEVKLDKTEFAIEMCKAFADKKKKNQLGAGQVNLFMSNSVNLATRIRVDIMKSIARKITKRDEIAYVAGFTSRPTMHIRRAGGRDTLRPLKSFSFIDSVSRFGNLLDRKDLETAYGRAGRSFNGQLRQNFVVLNEVEQEALFSVNPNLANQQQGQGQSGRGGAGGPRGGGGPRGTKRPGGNLDNSAPKK